jgi:hypothetical protein
MRRPYRTTSTLDEELRGPCAATRRVFVPGGPAGPIVERDRVVK